MALLKRVWAGSCAQQVEARVAGPYLCEHTITLLSDPSAKAKQSLVFVGAAAFTRLQKSISLSFQS